MALQKLSEIASGRELFVNLTLRELRGKYKRSTLGWTWSLINPLVTMGTYYLLFSFFLRVEPEVGDPSGLRNFAFFLMCGLLPFTYLSNALTGGMSSLVGNSNLVKKVYFPREILVAAITASWLVSFLIELAVLSVALLFVGNVVLPWIPVILLLVALETAFVLGLALMLAVWTVYFRDLEHLTGLVLQIWFYTAPIILPLYIVKDQLEGHRWAWVLYNVNPLMRFVEAYHDLLYSLRMPPAWELGYLFVVSAAVLGLGWYVFTRFEGRLAEEL
jgi:ABC-type polysaccharide/polyol phosphate export permease